MAIKVLVISNYRSYHGTRPEASIFIGLAKLGFDITIMTYGDAQLISEFREAGIKIIDYHPEKKNHKQAIKRIRETIIKEEIEILQLYNNPAIVNGIIAARGLPVKVILYRGYSGNVHWYDPTVYTKFLHPRVDKIICNSVGVEEMFHRQLFFDKRKTITINKGHDLHWYDGYDAHDIKAELALPEDAFVLVNVANNRRMKGIPYLLRAMCKLKPEQNIHLLIAGKGMKTGQNLRIVNKCNVQSNVHFLGFRSNVLNIVAGCDVFVLPSIKGESITKSVIEAMSLGVAPIISDIAGNRELVDHGKNGIVFKSKDVGALKDAILKLYNNRDLCKQMGEASKRHVNKNLNTEKTIREMKTFYKSLVI